jgi:nitric oxide reductase large subunit
MNCYTLFWRGQRSGPFTIEEIEQKLADNDIGLWHLVGDETSGLTVGDLLRQIDEEKRSLRLQQEQARQRAQRESEQKLEQQHSQAIQRLQEENEALADELDSVRASQSTSKVVGSPFVPGYPPQAPQVTQRASGQAITAFVFSLLNFVPGINLISWLIAIILAHSALSDMRRDPSLGGRGLAVAALWITYTLLFFGLVIGILIIIGSRN